MSTQLRRAARLWGIQTGYSDFDQKPQKTPEKTLKKLLEGLCGFSIETSTDLNKAIRKAHKNRVEKRVEPTMVVFAGKGFSFQVTLPKKAWSETLEIEIQLASPRLLRLHNLKEARPRREIQFEGELFERRTYLVSEILPTGYYLLSLLNDGKAIATSHILSRPPKKVQPHPKAWGVFAPLYALKSKRNLGIGDFTDMAEVQSWIRDLGGDFFGTLPLFSAVNEGDGADPSPYSPVSRLFWNEIYLDVVELAETSARAKEKLSSPDAQSLVRSLRESDLVDHKKVFALKKDVLETLASEFFESDESKSKGYQDFLKAEPLVKAYAKFRAESEGASDKYHLYVQFKVHEALERLARNAKERKTAGLYLDFPVGVSRSGFDASHFQSSFLNEASAGAPPDLLFHGGQDWGFAPFHPEEMRKNGYEYFRHCLRTNLKYATVLRLDHIMAFYRIYAIPKGLSPKEGGYLRYKSEEFFAVLAIEGERSQARVVGEDLGTVPDEVRNLILENDCLRMWVLPFEAGETPSKAIRKVPSQALACLNTHDLIPLAGYLAGHDSELFKDLGLLEVSERNKQQAERKKTVKSWMKDLKAHSSQDVLRESLKQLGRSAAEMVLVNIEDLWDETEPQNVPGTWRERPNWQRKLKHNISEIESNPEFRKTLSALAHERQDS